MVMTKGQAEAFIREATELESRWAPKVGGAELEPVRSIIGFAIAKLEAAGASFDDIDGYFADVFAMLRKAK